QLPAGHRRLLERLYQVELALDPIQSRDAHHITARGESECLENFRRSDSRKTRYAVRDEARPHAVLVMNGVAQDLRDDDGVMSEPHAEPLTRFQQEPRERAPLLSPVI